MAEGDEDKTYFFTEKGVFCYRQMPFRLKNAGATYQSAFKEDMLMDIQETFDRLQSINTKLNPKKCSFDAEERSFLGHLITKQEIKANPSKILARPKKLGRIAKWAIELGEHDIKFKGCNSIKGKILADFLAETPSVEDKDTEAKKPKTTCKVLNSKSTWKLYTDGASIFDGSDAIVDMKIKDLAIFINSQLMANQVKGLFKARQPVIKQYLEEITEVIKNFESYTMKHVQRDQNKKANALSELASMTFAHLAKEVLVEVFVKRSIVPREDTIGPQCILMQKKKYRIARPINFTHRALPMAPGGTRFLVVAIDYFTKWVEAKPLVSITGKHMEKFVWEHIVCKFRVPQIIIFDNEKQFSEGYFLVFCQRLGIYQSFTFVYHPQENGQVEVTHRDIINSME
ncbi:reverse transcriptase domain-containing protein [Tanacetum coccineum]